MSSTLYTPLLAAAICCCLSGYGHAEDNSATTTNASPASTDAADNTAPADPHVTHNAPTGQAGQPSSWNDTYIGYRVGNDFYYPGVRTASGAPAQVTQNVGFVTSTGGFRYGYYTFNADYLVSDKSNPEAGPTNAYGYPTAGPGGSQEVYSIGRVEFSASKVFGRSFEYGVIRDVGLTTGYEFGVKNDAFAERARMLVLGPTVAFAISRGYWNITAGVRTESNHDGITNVDVHFNPAFHAESTWLYPFQLGSLPLVFKGFASLTGPKGKDGAGVNTSTEFLARVSLMADVGTFAGYPRVAYVGIGYEYWHNMYGTPASEQPGTTQTSCPMLVAELHF